ncbi:hypothetical protein [Streptomyces sp. NPDC045470]|uniref:hypothetical protein n=1 Tax=Streptomyces sp. NPDC045470 TaxID=3155469 RepID=UPI0033CC7204
MPTAHYHEPSAGTPPVRTQGGADDRDCPGCRALSDEARQPGANAADILVRVILHEQTHHPAPPNQAVCDATARP